MEVAIPGKCIDNTKGGNGQIVMDVTYRFDKIIATATIGGIATVAIIVYKV